MTIQKQMIYEDKHIMVITKLAGQLSQPDKKNSPNLKNDLEHYLIASGQRHKSPFVGVVHRLDRPVGGVMVYGKTKEGTAELNRFLQNNGFKKEYLAVVKGSLCETKASLKHTLLKNQKTNTSTVVSDGTPKAKEALLDYEVLSTANHPVLGILSLVKIQLVTGRHHQIRVQFSEIGHPLVGDSKYGDKDKQAMGLWAYALTLKLPFKQEKRRFSIRPNTPPFSLFEFNFLE